MTDHERNNQLLLGTLDEVLISTIPMRRCDYGRTGYVITKVGNQDWTFKWVGVLINELTSWHVDPENGFRKQTRSNGTKYFFYSFVSNDQHYIILNIQDTITVKFSKSLVDKWQKEDIDIYSFKRSFYLKFTRKGSYAILRDSNLLFYSEHDFSSLYRKFCLSFISHKIANKSPDTECFFSYYDSFLEHAKYELIDFTTLTSKTEGYMYFHLLKNNNTRKKLDKITIGKDTFYILAGTYIAPFASSVVENKLINGMMLDTTFSFFANYYVSIPTIIIKNSGIPIGFTFALTENEQIYSDFFERYENIFGYKLATYVHAIESDQGTALKAVIEKQGVTHLICLRHLIVSLGKNKFSKQVSNLVSASCLKDFEQLKTIYSDAWRNINDVNERKELNDTLNKVGLAFINQKVIIINKDRWKQCSITERIQLKMPSCTNQIESMHGHLNAQISRRNEFFHSLKKLIDMIQTKKNTFEALFKKNYPRHKKKINDILQNTPPEIVESQIKYYETNLESATCTCGESALISSMMEAKIPCTHLIHMGAQFPDIQPPEIVFDNTFEKELFYEYEIHESKEIHADSNYYTKMRSSAVNTIKRFSHYRSTSKITEFVKNRLPFTETPQCFIFGYPTEVISVIDDGIRIFSKDIKDELDDSKPENDDQTE